MRLKVADLHPITHMRTVSNLARTLMITLIHPSIIRLRNSELFRTVITVPYAAVILVVQSFAQSFDNRETTPHQNGSHHRRCLGCFDISQSKGRQVL